MCKPPYRSLTDGALWASSRRDAISGLIFIPPLIGDTAISQLHRFRRLRQDGFGLYTFAFPGHPGAGGRFSLKAATKMTRHHMERARLRANRMATPLFGLGCCAAAIPLLAAAQAAPMPPTHLVLINPIVRFSPTAVLSAFWRYSREYSRSPLRQLRSLPSYLEHLFPGIIKDHQRFGALKRRRAALPRLVMEILYDRLLATVRITRTPVTCCYGEADALIRHLIPQGAKAYEASIRHHCPRSIFKPMQGSHFFTGAPLRHRLRRTITAAFGMPQYANKKGTAGPPP